MNISYFQTQSIYLFNFSNQQMNISHLTLTQSFKTASGSYKQAWRRGLSNHYVSRATRTITSRVLLEPLCLACYCSQSAVSGVTRVLGVTTDPWGIWSSEVILTLPYTVENANRFRWKLSKAVCLLLLFWGGGCKLNQITVLSSMIIDTNKMRMQPCYPNIVKLDTLLFETILATDIRAHTHTHPLPPL